MVLRLFSYERGGKAIFPPVRPVRGYYKKNSALKFDREINKNWHEFVLIKMTHFKKHYEAPTCSICMEDLTDGLSVATCGHVFHTLW